MATYSRTNGWIALGIAVLCFVVALVDGASGNVPFAALFGSLALVTGLQGMDDLVWHGRRDGVVVPLKRSLVVVAVLCVVWTVVELLY